MATEEKMDHENQPAIDKTIDTVGKVLLIFGVVVHAFSQFIFHFLLSQAGAFWVRLTIYVTVPVGLSLILYARRRQLRSFVQEAKREGVTKALENIARRNEGLGPESINDPLAQKIQWSPIKPVASQLSMKLYQQDENYLHIRYGRRPIYQSLILASIFAVLACSPYWIPNLPANWVPADIAGLAQELSSFILVIGFVLIAVAMIPFYGARIETIIDRQKGTLTQIQPWFSIRRSISLGNAHAIQLLTYKRNSSKAWVQYEMNLVLGNEERMHLMGSDSCSELQRNSECIARYLGLPVWDKTNIVHDESIIWMQELQDKE